MKTRMETKYLSRLQKSCIPLLLIFASFSNVSYAQSDSENAQVNSGDKPRVSMTMLLIPETTACRPSYDPRQECRLWKYEEVQDLLKRRDTYVIEKRDIPPSEISLGDDLFVAIDKYSRSPRRYPWERKAILIVFNFEKPQGTPKKPVPFTFSRRSPSREVPPKTFSTSGKFDGDQVWIDYERADSFLPAYEVEWSLKVGDYRWTYKTKR